MHNGLDHPARYLEELKKKYSSLTALFERLSYAFEAWRRLPVREFFETVSMIEKKEAGGELVTVSALLLDSWRQHVAFGNGIRMRTLEETVLRELVSGSLLAGAIIGRSHMESAGMAAWCQKELLSCARQGNFSPFRKIIPRHFMGISLRKDAKLKALSEAQDFRFEEPQTVMDGIDALDSFSENPVVRKQRVFRARYASLCEYAHPLVRSLKGFSSNKEMEGEGWIIRYSSVENIHHEDLQAFVRIFLDNVCAGWANVLMLAHSKIFPAGGGEIGYESASKTELSWISEKLLAPERQ